MGQNDGVIPFPARQKITQVDLEEFILLERRFEEARSRLLEKRRYILDALENGARIENGVHDASIALTFRVCHGANKLERKRLIVR